MPTGYTSIIEEKPDVSLREYALRCARAFGACIAQREDDLDAPPRAPKVDDYHLKEAARKRAELDRLRSMTPEASKVAFDAVVASRNALAEASKRKTADLRERYLRVRSAVEGWEPPTSDHAGLKKFMLDQIDLCKLDWDGEPYAPYVPASAEVWLAEEIASTESGIAYHERYYAEEVARAKKAGAWLAALDGSLPPP